MTNLKNYLSILEKISQLENTVVELTKEVNTQIKPIFNHVYDVSLIVEEMHEKYFSTPSVISENVNYQFLLYLKLNKEFLYRDTKFYLFNGDASYYYNLTNEITPQFASEINSVIKVFISSNPEKVEKVGENYLLKYEDVLEFMIFKQ